MSRATDIVIVGGGPVGAVQGALLARSTALKDSKIVLLERDLPPAAEDFDAAAELRVFALSRASERICRAADAWAALEALPGATCAYQRMHVWPADSLPRGEGSLTFDAAELGEADLGHIVANGALQRTALAALRAAGGVVHASTVSDLVFEADGVRVVTDAGEWRAALVIGADGGRSVVRRCAGLGAEQQDYAQQGVVANLHSERPHEHTAWQRFLGDGTLALLPLADGRCSLVWSVPSARAAELLQLAPQEFSQQVTTASDGVLGTLTLASERRAFALRRVQAPEYVKERCALVGDAAHIVHPLAGQGVNLGLLDAAALLDSLEDGAAAGEPPGSLRVLRRYERWRKGENSAMGYALDLFNRHLAFGDGAVGRLARRGLDWVGRTPTLRRGFAARALGLEGELPRAVSRVGRVSPRR